jgi:hypothetical protein
MQNTYADIDVDLSSMLHGAVRLHVSLGRMDETGISTRGWTYNEMIDGILAINSTEDPAVKMHRSISCLFDTLDGLVEIGPRAVYHLTDLTRMAML